MFYRLKLNCMLALCCMFACSVEKSVQIRQINTELPVIIRYNTKTNRIFKIRFPFSFEYTHSFLLRRLRVEGVVYYYYREFGKSWSEYSGDWSPNVSVYQKDGVHLIDRGIGGRKNAKPVISRFQLQELIAYTVHDIDTSAAVQSFFKPYLERRETLEGSGDTLFIGTFDEFRKSQPELTKMLLEGDSICFDIYKGDGGLENYATTVYLPIKY
jgi:hypothetical protein